MKFFCIHARAKSLGFVHQDNGPCIRHLVEFSKSFCNYLDEVLFNLNKLFSCNGLLNGNRALDLQIDKLGVHIQTSLNILNMLL